MILGSHLSIGRGMHRAVEHAANYGFAALAMFVRNQVQWAARPLDAGAVKAFRAARRRCGIAPVVAHASYLVNLAGRSEIRRKSIPAMVTDLDRCGELGIEYLVMHPGSNENEREGIRRIAEGIDTIFDRLRRRRPKLLLETTAGQGNSIGHRFEQLAEILRKVGRKRRVGICLDTCHAFAAGYDLTRPSGYREMMDELAGTVGLDALKAIHLNDSKKPLASRVDRHEHLGAGRIGKRGFHPILRDKRLANVPFILETPKGTAPDGRDWDDVNAAFVRKVARI